MISLSRSGGVTAACVVLLSIANTAGAQTGATVLTGRVTSDQGVPITGANVYVTEMNLSVGTNQTGQYTISVPAGRVSGQTVQLRVRSVGFTPQAKPVTLNGTRVETNFSLVTDVLRLSEVVVTGVSAAVEAVKVPFAVTRIDSTKMPVVGGDAVRQLQGKVPGATIVGAGRPGSSPSIVLRGVTSLNASGRSQGPLYMIDGVMLQGDLPDINPNDIESMEVVSGAAAASLYGPRAGTGVINITTRRGRNGENGVRFNVSSELGAGDIERRWPQAKYTFMALDPSGTLFCSGGASNQVGGSNCARYINIEQETRRVNDQPLDFSLSPQTFLRDYGISSAPNYAALTGTYQANPWPTIYDPINQLVTSSASANTQLDARGTFSNTGTNFFASANNTTSQGAVRYLSGYRRNAGRLNLDQRVGEKLSFQMNTYLARTWTDGANFDNNGPWFSITRQSPFIDLLARDAQGRLFIRSNPLAQGAQNANPAYQLENLKQIDRGGRFLGNMNGKYQATEWLSFNGLFGYDRGTGTYTRLQDRGYRTTSSSPTTAAGEIREGAGDNQSLNSSVSGTARHTFFNDLDVSLSGSYTYNLRDNNNLDLIGQSLVVPGLYTADAAIVPQTTSSSKTQIREIGELGNLRLEYKGRYIIDGAIRHDGSSLFGPNERWHTFGRLAGTWIASEEPWWFAPRALDLFKIRASYGKSGNSPAFNEQYETFTIGTGGTLNPNTLGNKALRPEVKTDLEVGLDADFFKHANLALTLVESHVDDQILPVRPAAVSGFSQQWQNVGKIRNRTIEASLDVPILSKRNITWSSRLIYDRTLSTIERLDVPPFTGDITVNNTFTVYQFREGERIGTMYGQAFVKNCGELPSAFQGQCGGEGKAFQKNDAGVIVWVGEGNKQTEGLTRNLWTTALPAANAPWSTRANWGMPMLRRDSANAPLYTAIGNGSPEFHLGMSHSVTYKRLSAYGLIDGSFGQELWNTGYHWSLGDFTSSDEDQFGKSVESAKPFGYYWRRGPGISGNSGVGGLYDALGVNNYSMEDGSYAKIREISMNYRIGRVAGVGNWTLGVVGRNLYTFTNFRGWDPETGTPGGQLNNAALNGAAAYRFPNLRTFTVRVATSF
jgi:TonB-linked SusC/RagA family outer membrane protein